MKLLHEERLIGSDEFLKKHPQLAAALDQVREAITKVVWPIGSRKFTIRPQIDGNGVMPIKVEFLKHLDKNHAWLLEQAMPLVDGLKPGKIDAIKKTNTDKWIAVEWETGNISSSHRALNKMALGILKGKLLAGILVLPDRQLYKYLTQRIGNYAEIAPYFPLYKSIKGVHGYLAVFSVLHDDISPKVPKIPKQFDGNAKIALLRTSLKGLSKKTRL